LELDLTAQKPERHLPASDRDEFRLQERLGRSESSLHGHARAKFPDEDQRTTRRMLN
jgi:hypothetical protein